MLGLMELPIGLGLIRYCYDSMSVFDRQQLVTILFVYRHNCSICQEDIF